MSARFLLVILIVVAIAAAGYALWQREATEKLSVWDASDRWSGSPHADRTAESFIHWDADEPPVVPADCAKCHSTYGFEDFLGADGSPPGTVEKDAKVGSVLFCTTCHNSSARTMTVVTFPSGASVSGLGFESSCMSCHQGRESTFSVNNRLKSLEPDTVSDQLSFVNPHYVPAAATQMGGQVMGAYQYDGQSYVGKFLHTKGFESCAKCHDPHSLTVDPKPCSACHSNVAYRADLRSIREDKTDYDGDGNTGEGIAAEITTLQQTLLAAIQRYAEDVLGKPIVYSVGDYPYFFNDTNGNGTADIDEIKTANGFKSWTPRLVRATYDFHYSQKDPGSFAHNAKYAIQVMYDSLADLGQKVPVQMERMTRPK